MEKIISKIVPIHELNLIGIFRNDDGEIFLALNVKKNKNKLEIISLVDSSDIESLYTKLNPKTPVIIIIDGKGVLNKKIDLKNSTDTDWYKNLDFNTIDFTSYNNENFKFLSFCRQNIAEDIIAKFHTIGFNIIDFYIGGLMAVLLLDTIKQDSIISNDMILFFENEELIDITKSNEINIDKRYDVGDKSISNYYLPLYGAAINFYVNQKNIEKSYNKSIKSEEVIYKIAFDKLGIYMIIGFFLLLLSSYSLIQYFNAQNTQLNLKNLYSNQTFELIQQLEKQKANKETIINQTGIGASKFISFYSYEITNTVPTEINLSNLDIFPIQQEIKTAEKVQLGTKIILLQGATENEQVLNYWIEKLRNYKWINKLEIVSIKKDKFNNSNFQLKLQL